MLSERKPYKSDLDDETYLFILPYFLLAPEDAHQRVYPIREVLNAALWIGRTGSQWEYLPHDFPPYKIVHQQLMRWFERGCFENLAHDLHSLVREDALLEGVPTVAIVDSRTLQSTPESGERAGYDGGKRRKGSKIHAAVDTMGNVMTLLVTPGNEQDREQVYDLCREVQQVTGDHIDVVIADQGYTGEQPQIDASLNDVELVVVKRPTGATGFVLLPLRWVVERTFAWTARFRRLSRDLERLQSSLLGFHWLAVSVTLPKQIKANSWLASLTASTGAHCVETVKEAPVGGNAAGASACTPTTRAH